MRFLKARGSSGLMAVKRVVESESATEMSVAISEVDESLGFQILPFDGFASWCMPTSSYCY